MLPRYPLSLDYPPLGFMGKRRIPRTDNSAIGPIGHKASTAVRCGIGAEPDKEGRIVVRRDSPVKIRAAPLFEGGMNPGSVLIQHI